MRVGEEYDIGILKSIKSNISDLKVSIVTHLIQPATST